MNKKSILAIIAGVLFTVIVTTLVDLALHAANVFPPADQPLSDELTLLATSYRIVISVAGAWLTARLAPHKPMKHAIVLGVVGTILGVIGVVATWNLGKRLKSPKSANLSGPDARTENGSCVSSTSTIHGGRKTRVCEATNLVIGT